MQVPRDYSRDGTLRRKSTTLSKDQRRIHSRFLLLTLRMGPMGSRGARYRVRRARSPQSLLHFQGNGAVPGPLKFQVAVRKRFFGESGIGHREARSEDRLAADGLMRGRLNSGLL